MTAFGAQQETDFAVNLPGKLVCCLPSRLSVVEKRSCVLLWGGQSAGGQRCAVGQRPGGDAKGVLLCNNIFSSNLLCCQQHVECCPICCVVKTMIQDKSRMMHGLSFIVAVV